LFALKKFAFVVVIAVLVLASLGTAKQYLFGGGSIDDGYIIEYENYEEYKKSLVEKGKQNNSAHSENGGDNAEPWQDGDSDGGVSEQDGDSDGGVSEQDGDNDGGVSEQDGDSGGGVSEQDGDNGGGALEQEDGLNSGGKDGQEGGEQVENGGAEAWNYPFDTALLLKATAKLNIRSGAGTAYPVMGSIAKNAMLPFVKQENEHWYQTVYKGQKAFLSAKYVVIAEFVKNSAEVERVIAEGMLLLGYPYVYGAPRYHWGNGKLNPDFVMGKFDCSSLTQYAYYKGARVLLDLTTRTQVVQGKAVEKEDLARGDLMFFTNGSRKNKSGIERVGHVAIYLGANYILHTASDYAVIEPISPLRHSYYITARRFL
jgi:cell wall-associated NlpC family hydrolase